MEKLVFTRYLYPVIWVKQSLLLSMLEKNTKESLFWAYEIFYSGFEKDIFEYLEMIYENFYKSENLDIKKLFSQPKNEFLLGTLIMTLCSRNYQICQFVKSYFSKDIEPLIHGVSKFKFIIQCKENDIVEYKTVLPEREKARFYLNIVCKYGIRTEYDTLFETPYSDIKSEFYYQWTYYASKSPIWLDRIEDLGGSVNDEKLEIEFANDELSDAFYDIWGLEPDEQKTELINKCIGNCEIKQLSIDDFCRKYVGNQGSPTTPPLLVNSIVLHKN